MKKTTFILATAILIMAIVLSMVAFPKSSITSNVHSYNYMYNGPWKMNPNDQLSISYTGTKAADVYVMTNYGLNKLSDLGEDTYYYEVRFQHIISCNYQFTAEHSGQFYVVIYNKDLSIVHAELTITYDPLGFNVNFFLIVFLNIMLLVVVPVDVVLTIVFLIDVYNKRKEKGMDVPKFSSNQSLQANVRYCNNCGSPLKEAATFCENCGTQNK